MVAGLITSCPRFVVDVALPAVSCIGDRLWGRRCSKGWTRKSNVARFERQKFSTVEKRAM